MIHLRVVSPPDLTETLMPMLHSEPAVMNVTVLLGAVSHPDGDAVQFDVLHGAANEVIGQLRDLGLDQRGSIVLENVDTSISAGRRTAGQRLLEFLLIVRRQGGLQDRSAVFAHRLDGLVRCHLLQHQEQRRGAQLDHAADLVLGEPSPVTSWIFPFIPFHPVGGMIWQAGLGEIDSARSERR